MQVPLIFDHFNTFTGSTTGKPLAAKPSKIVAGQEPEKTNELLQCLAKALDEKLSSEEAVKKYKESTKPAQVSEPKSKEPIKSTKKAVDPKKLTSRSSEKLGSQRNDVTRSTTKQDKEKANDGKSKRKETGSVKAEPQNLKKTQQSKSNNVKGGKENIKEKKDLPKDDMQTSRTKNMSSNHIDKEKDPSTPNKSSSQESNTTEEKENQVGKTINIDQLLTPRMEQDDDGKLNSSYTIAENELNSSASSNDLNEITNNNKQDQISSQEVNTNKETAFIDVERQNQTDIDVNDDVKLKSLELDVNIQEKQTTHNQAFIEAENKNINTEKDPVPSVKIPITSIDTKVPRPPSVRPSSSRPGAPRMREKLDNVIKDSDNLLLGKVNIIIENTQNEEVC